MNKLNTCFKSGLLSLVFCFLVTASGLLHAGAPQKINFQGRLEESGQPAEGAKNFIFKLYDALSAGSLVWTSQAQSVAVTNGVFSVVLETGTPVNLSTAAFAGARYVEITVDGVPLSPRQEMVSAPYALVAQALAPDAVISLSSLEKDPSSVSVINTSTNAVDWTQLKNVPAGLADGTDDSGGATFSTAAIVSGKFSDERVSISTGAFYGGFNAADQLLQLDGAGKLDPSKLSGAVPVTGGGTGKTGVAADRLLYTSALNTFSEAPISAAGRALAGGADAAAQRAALELGMLAILGSVGDGEITDVSPSKLSAPVGVPNGGTGLATIAAGNLIYASALDTLAASPISAAGRALIDDADTAAQRATLGLGALALTGSELDPVFTAHASFGIGSGDITNWNNAFGWGDHASIGYAAAAALNNVAASTGTLTMSLAAVVLSTGTIAANLSTETSARSGADSALTVQVNSVAASTGTLTSNLAAVALSTGSIVAQVNSVAASTGTLTVNLSAVALSTGPLANSGNWNTAFGWGDHAAAGYSVLGASQAFTGSPVFASTVAFTALNESLPGVTVSSGLVVAAGLVGLGTDSPNSVLSVGGSISLPVKTISGTDNPYSVTANDSTIFVAADTGAISASLPSATGIAGRIYTFKLVNDNFSVSIAPSGAETLDGRDSSAPFTMDYRGDFVTIQSDGTNWMIVGVYTYQLFNAAPKMLWP